MTDSQRLIERDRLSKNHRLVLDLVEELGVGRHLSMAELYEVARARRPSIGFTTVYRALVRLRDAGLVAEITLPGADSAYYEQSAPPHAHFRCQACGQVKDIAIDVPADFAPAAERQLAARVTSMALSFEGYCASCAHLAT